MDIPGMNFVGQLQEKCQAARIPMPIYNDESTENVLRFSCKLNDWVCHGTGSSKKFAKHNSAKEMLNQIEEGKLSLGENAGIAEKNSISKIFEFCAKKKVENQQFPMAMFKELPNEDELFCCQCSLGDSVAVGKGHSKKEAKEMAASKVGEEFGMNEYFDNLKKVKERKQALTSPIQELFMFCRSKQLDPPTFEVFEEMKNNLKIYRVTCSVGEVKVESGLVHSKKSAKCEAATLLLQSLKMDTPSTSPSEKNIEKRRASLKRKLSSDSSDSE